MFTSCKIIEFRWPASTCEYYLEDPDPPLTPGRVRSELNIYTRNFKDPPQPQEKEMAIKVNKEVSKVSTAVNTDPIVIEERIVEKYIEKVIKVDSRNAWVNTDPPPVPPRKVGQGTNTVATTTNSKSTSPVIGMDYLVTRDEMEAR